MRINATAEAKPGFHQNWIRMDFYEQRESKPLFIVLSYWFEKKKADMWTWLSERPLTILLTGKKKKNQPTRKRDVAVIFKRSTR